MKNTILLFALFLGFATFGQDKPVEEIKTLKIQELEDVCILWPAELISPPLVFNADDYYRGQVVQAPFEYKVGTSQAGTGSMPLSEDLPFVHTLNGSVYTFDYLRNSIRY